jgi:RNase P subunit RPR2
MARAKKTTTNKRWKLYEDGLRTRDSNGDESKHAVTEKKKIQMKKKIKIYQDLRIEIKGNHQLIYSRMTQVSNHLSEITPT